MRIALIIHDINGHTSRVLRFAARAVDAAQSCICFLLLGLEFDPFEKIQ